MAVDGEGDEKKVGYWGPVNGFEHTYGMTPTMYEPMSSVFGDTPGGLGQRLQPEIGGIMPMGSFT